MLSAMGFDSASSGSLKLNKGDGDILEGISVYKVVISHRVFLGVPGRKFLPSSQSLSHRKCLWSRFAEVNSPTNPST